jgi:hypothetical protein
MASKNPNMNKQGSAGKRNHKVSTASQKPEIIRMPEISKN